MCVACVCVRVCVWCCTWCVGWRCCDTSGLGSSRSSSAHTTLRVVCEKKRGRSATQKNKSSWSCPHRGKISGGENSPERTTPKPARATHPPRPKNTRSPRGVSFLGPSPSPSCSSSSWLITVLSSWPFYEQSRMGGRTGRVPSRPVSALKMVGTVRLQCSGLDRWCRTPRCRDPDHFGHPNPEDARTT